MPCHCFLQLTEISSPTSSGPHNTTAHGAWDKILVASVLGFVRRTTSARAAPAAFATSCKPRRPNCTYGCTSCPKEVYNPRNLKEAGMKRVTVLGALLVI